MKRKLPKPSLKLNSGEVVAAKTENATNASTVFTFDSLPEMPIQFIEPMLSEPVAELPDDGARWSFEIKLDGYRCLALRDRTGVKLYSRRKNLLNSRFPAVAKDLHAWALTREEMRNCIWLKPELVAQVHFVEWTPDNHLRAARFAGLREDKQPRQIVQKHSLPGR